MVTKKDPSGWWDAELKGKRGVIPGTFVEDYTVLTPPVPVPPVPVPVPVPSPSKGIPEDSFDIFLVVDMIFFHRRADKSWG